MIKLAKEIDLPRQVWIMALVVICGTFMSILDTTIINVALEELARDFQVPLSDIQWIVTAYMLALAAVIPLTGFMGERFSSKRIFMWAIFLFVLGSLLSGLAWSNGSLVVFRVLQGLGGGMLMPTGMSIIASLVSPQKMGRVMGILGVPMLLAPVVGPPLGGLFIEVLSWHFIFFINVPIGILAFFLARKYLPEGKKNKDKKLDWVGFLLLSPGTTLLVFGLAEIAQKGDFFYWGGIIPSLLGVILIVCFFFWKPNYVEKLLDTSLFKNRRFLSSTLTTLFVGAALFGAMIIIPLYYQFARDLSALQAGLLMIPQGIGAALAMPISGILADKMNPGKVVFIGITVTLVGTLPFIFLMESTPYFLLMLALLIRGLGIGFTMMPAISASYQTLSHEQIPRATSTLNIIQRLGGALGTSLLAVYLDSQLSQVERGSSALEEVNSAFSHTFLMAFFITLIAFLPTIFLIKSPVHHVEENKSSKT